MPAADGGPNRNPGSAAGSASAAAVLSVSIGVTASDVVSTWGSGSAGPITVGSNVFSAAAGASSEITGVSGDMAGSEAVSGGRVAVAAMVAEASATGGAVPIGPVD